MFYFFHFQNDLKDEVKRLFLRSLSDNKPSSNYPSSFENVAQLDAETVAHFLKKHKFLYSLSVFVAEAKLDPKKVR